jgi:hypothetical protein
MGEETWDATPEGHVLHSFANAKRSWRVVLAELIDNALDAGARAVTVGISKTALSVEDDGRGCGDAGLRAMVTLGDHQQNDSTRSGMYGVGGKHAVLAIGGVDSTLTISTTRAEDRARLVVRWADLAQTGWRLDAPVKSPRGEEPTGTRIEVRPVIKGLLTGKSLDRLLGDLGDIYTPALESGVSLIVARRVLRPCALPELRQWVDVRVDVKGKTARGRVGIVAEGVRNDKPGIAYRHGFRLIERSNRGCGDYPPTRIAGYIDLDDSWTRSTNKDTLHGAEDLYEAIYDQILDLLKEAETATYALSSSALLSEVADSVNARLGLPDRKAVRRARRQKEGTVTPTGTGGRHTQAAEDQPGTTFSSRRGRSSGRINVAVDHRGEGEPYAHVSGGRRATTITLNLDVPMVRQAHDSFDRSMLATLVFAAVCAGRVLGTDEARQMQMPDVDGSQRDQFLQLLTHCLSSPADLDGQGLAAE